MTKRAELLSLNTQQHHSSPVVLKPSCCSWPEPIVVQTLAHKHRTLPHVLRHLHPPQCLMLIYSRTKKRCFFGCTSSRGGIEGGGNTMRMRNLDVNDLRWE